MGSITFLVIPKIMRWPKLELKTIQWSARASYSWWRKLTNFVCQITHLLHLIFFKSRSSSIMALKCYRQNLLIITKRYNPFLTVIRTICTMVWYQNLKILKIRAKLIYCALLLKRTSWRSLLVAWVSLSNGQSFTSSRQILNTSLFSW